MNRTRLWLIGGAFAAVAIIAGGWFLGAQPFLTAAATADSDRAAVEQLNTIQTARIATLEAAGEDLENLTSQAEELTAAIPVTSASGDFLSDVAARAGTAEVSITSLVESDAQLMADAAATAASAVPVEEAPEGEPVAVDAAAAPVASIPSMVALPVQMTVTGGFDQLQNFVGLLHQGKRLMTVSNVSIEEVGEGNAYSLSLTGSLYYLPSTV